MNKINGNFKIIDEIESWLIKSVNEKVKVYLYGSFRLYTAQYNPDIDGEIPDDCDIDLLILCPKNFKMDVLVEKMKNNDQFQNMVYLKEAHVPLINFLYKNIEIDMIFSFVSDLNLDILNYNVNTLDEKTALSMNGYRTTEYICSHVPNMHVFRNLLLKIKNWSKSLGIYSNKYCYLGGISWAIMTAHICINYPFLESDKLVEKFFKVFSKWHWKLPILLAPLIEKLEGHRSWNHHNKSDNRHNIKIITPVYPHINTSYNVTKSAAWLIKYYLQTTYKNIQLNNSISCDPIKNFNCSLTYPIIDGVKYEHKFKNLITNIEIIPGIRHVFMSSDKDYYQLNIIFEKDHTSPINLFEPIKEWINMTDTSLPMNFKLCSFD